MVAGNFCFGCHAGKLGCTAGDETGGCSNGRFTSPPTAPFPRQRVGPWPTCCFPPFLFEQLACFHLRSSLFSLALEPSGDLGSLASPLLLGVTREGFNFNHEIISTISIIFIFRGLLNVSAGILRLLCFASKPSSRLFMELPGSSQRSVHSLQRSMQPQALM